MSETFHYGGQALIEGVMMRGRTTIAMAVRCPNDKIDVASLHLPGIYTGKARKLPLIRGVLVLTESMVLGIQALFHSANVSLGEEEEEISGPWLWIVLALSLAFAVGLFFVTPLLLAKYVIAPHLEPRWAVHVVEGVLRIVIFALYLLLMNLIPAIRRVFSYHGAEHKTINAYEDGAPLQVEAVRKYSTAHLRCGTSFLLAVMIIAIIMFVLIGQPAMWIRILSRIVLVPVIAGIAYELTRFSATHADNRIIHPIFAPGLALQALTTRQPNDSQIEVAIAALKRVLQDDAVEEGQTHTNQENSPTTEATWGPPTTE